MCRSVYLSGLLMSHGTDSVRTRRATAEHKKKHSRTMKPCGRLKLDNRQIKKDSLSGPVSYTKK